MIGNLGGPLGFMTHAVVIVGRKTGRQLVIALTDSSADAQTLADRHGGSVIGIHDLLVEPDEREALTRRARMTMPLPGTP